MVYEETTKNPFTQFLSPDMKKKAEEGQTRRYESEIKRQVQKSAVRMWRPPTGLTRAQQRAAGTGWTPPGVAKGKPADLVLKPVEVVEKLPPYPEELGPVTIIPWDMRNPTALYIGTELGGGSGRPWTNATQLASPGVIGQMIVTVGKYMIFAIGMTSMQDIAGMLRTQLTREGRRLGVKIRYATGRPGGTGGIAPRGPSGKSEGATADSYENGDGFVMAESWTWF